MTLFLLAGCGLTPPETGFRPTEAARQAPFPALLPSEDLEEIGQRPDIQAAPTTELDARVAALRAKAEALNTPVLDSETQSRLEAAGDG
ncbi:MAG: hypothetical protein AAF813_00640 [Pseudomonadota bacterium]